MARTLNQVIDEATDAYLQNLNLQNPPAPAVVEQELVTKVADEIALENQYRAKGDKFRAPKSLSFDQIASLMAVLYPIKRISCAGISADPEYDLLAIYMPDGPEKGIYTTVEDEFRKIAIQYNRRLSSHDFAEVMGRLRILVPRTTRCMNRDLIAVDNGIFNYATKTLQPFSEDYVFMAKSHVAYNPNAINVPITEPDGSIWDIETWMSGLSDDPEVINVLWQILGAIIRPLVRWNKSAWFYSESGNNGKGTLCELMRQLCGESSYTAIPLCDFSKDFVLEPLTRSTAIIVDENDVGTFIDKAANLKSVITNDVIMVNRKFKMPISYQFYGFMVQCLNEFPRIKDKSDSFYRRQLFIPFDKCFTGQEKKYIKEDYLHRQAVLEYVLYRVLNMPDYYKLDEPESCVKVLNEYKDFNNPVRQFFEEMSPLFKWDLLPFSFLYELYKAWFRKNAPNGQLQSRNTFIPDIINIATSTGNWYCLDKSKNIRSGNRMDDPEPLIAMYDLADWKNPRYTGNDIDRISTTEVKPFYRGLLRYNGTMITSDDTDDSVTGGDGE